MRFLKNCRPFLYTKRQQINTHAKILEKNASWWHAIRTTSFSINCWKSKILVIYTISKFPNTVKVFIWDCLFWKYTRLISQVVYIYYFPRQSPVNKIGFCLGKVWSRHPVKSMSLDACSLKIEHMFQFFWWPATSKKSGRWVWLWGWQWWQEPSSLLLLS